MANYGIGGMVPDVVGAIGGGLQTARGLDYWDDRKRRIAQQESQQKRQAMADFSLIAKNVDRNNPAQVKQALAWAATRSPQMKDTVWKALQGTPEEQLNFIDMFQAPERREDQTQKQLDQELKQKAANIKTSKDLRAEIYKETGEFQKITNAFDRIAVSGKEPTAAGDLSLIFNYMKMLDPNSVVRESEFATAANAAGVPDRVRNVFNKIVSGKRLAPTQRKQFIGEAKKLFDSANRRNEKTLDFYRSYGERIGVPVEDIIVERGKPTKVDLKKIVAPKTEKYGDVTEEDIQETMRANNMTREQVLERIGEQ